MKNRIKVEKAHKRVYREFVDAREELEYWKEGDGAWLKEEDREDWADRVRNARKKKNVFDQLTQLLAGLDQATVKKKKLVEFKEAYEDFKYCPECGTILEPVGTLTDGPFANRVYRCPEHGDFAFSN